MYVGLCVCVCICLKPIGPIAPNRAPRPILQILEQVDWESGPTEIVHSWGPAPPKAGPAYLTLYMYL